MKFSIEGVECKIYSSVHQSDGYIFLKKQTDEYDSIDATTFSLEETEKIRFFLEMVGNFSVSSSPSTYYPGYGSRVTMMSIYVSRETIDELFSNFLIEKLKTI